MRLYDGPQVKSQIKKRTLAIPHALENAQNLFNQLPGLER